MAHTPQGEGIVEISEVHQLLSLFHPGIQYNCVTAHLTSKRKQKTAPVEQWHGQGIPHAERSIYLSPSSTKNRSWQAFYCGGTYIQDGSHTLQVSGKDCIHPVEFFFWKLSTAKRNYDMVNKDLLAIKLALEGMAAQAWGGKVPLYLHEKFKVFKSTILHIIWHLHVIPAGTEKHLGNRLILYSSQHTGGRWAQVDFAKRISLIKKELRASNIIGLGRVHKCICLSLSLMTEACMIPSEIVHIKHLSFYANSLATQSMLGK